LPKKGSMSTLSGIIMISKYHLTKGAHLHKTLDASGIQWVYYVHVIVWSNGLPPATAPETIQASYKNDEKLAGVRHI
jgi:hypothetical protein